MKRKRRSPEQIIRELREADQMLSEGAGLATACQALEVSEATFHRWRNQCGGMKANESKRLKELEIENGRLYSPSRRAHRPRLVLRLRQRSDGRRPDVEAADHRG